MYKRISQDKAYEMMQNESNLILDARTPQEFAGARIKNAVNISHAEVAARATSVFPDKKSTILVYCRSGARSRVASAALDALGYEHVYEFGGIMSWKYGVVTS